MKTRNFFLFLLFSCSTLLSFSQRQADAVIPYSSNIDNILLSPLTGYVIVKEQDKISCYNPATQKNEWEVTKDQIGKLSSKETAENAINAMNSLDMTKILASNDNIAFIPGSPFLRGVISNRDVIINAIDGKIVFNSGTKNYRITKSEFLSDANSFLFIATDGKKMNCILYDLLSGTEKWTTELASVESFMKSFANVFSFKSSGAVAEDEVKVVGDAIYSTIYGKLYKLDKGNGNILWNTDYQLNKFFLSQTGKDIIVIKNAGSVLSSKQVLNILNGSNGQMIWKDDLKTKYVSYLEDWGDKILIAHNSGFNFFTYSDGQQVWKKDAKGSDIKRVIPIDKDYLYVSENEMNLIDKDGKSKWKNFIEISDDKADAIHYLGKVDNNRVFYLTSTYGNMVDYSSGKKIWKKNIEFDKKRPLLYGYDENKNVFLTYNDKRIFKFDPNTTDKPEPVAKLKVDNDKSMSNIELFDWGMALVGENDIIGVGFDGNTKYHNTYKEPGAAMRKTLKVTSGIGKAYFGTLGSLQSGLSNATVTVQYRDAKGNLVEETHDLFNAESKARLQEAAAGNQQTAGMINNTILSKVKDRYKAMKANSEYAFIFTRGDNGESTQLVKVRKSDGQEVDKIAIDNNKPVYEVDPATDDIYYVYKNELRIFTKK